MAGTKRFGPLYPISVITEYICAVYYWDEEKLENTPLRKYPSLQTRRTRHELWVHVLRTRSGLGNSTGARGFLSPRGSPHEKV